MLGITICTGGSNVTPAGCNVQANGGAAPSDLEAKDLNGVTKHVYGPETYKEFILRASRRYRSALVKLADLQRNAAPKAHRTEKHIEMALNRYIPAMQVITKALLKFEQENPQGIPDSKGW